jgi:hypothetical protein
MSPHPATRRNGTCTGSLWKSHSRNVVAVPAVPAAAGSRRRHPEDDDVDDGGGGSSSSESRRPPSSSSESPSYFEGALAEANERQQRTHHEFCVLVGDELWSYTDVWAYVKGDPPTVSCICFFEEMGGTTTTTTTRERERDLLIGGFDV